MSEEGTGPSDPHKSPRVHTHMKTLNFVYSADKPVTSETVGMCSVIPPLRDLHKGIYGSDVPNMEE